MTRGHDTRSTIGLPDGWEMTIIDPCSSIPEWELTCNGVLVAFGQAERFTLEPIWGRCVSADPEVKSAAEMVFYMHLAACKQAERDRRDSWEAEAVLARKEAAAKAEDAVREWIRDHYFRTGDAPPQNIGTR